MVNELSATERRAQLILQELLGTGKIAVGSLAKRLKVSAATIRRDLREMERRGLLRRSHGGAIPIQPFLYEPFRHISYYHEQERQHSAEKRRIALVASELVSDGDILAIGAGTTATRHAIIDNVDVKRFQVIGGVA